MTITSPTAQSQTGFSTPHIHHPTTPPPKHRFPQDIDNALGGLDYRILNILAHLSNCQAKRSPTAARYAIPSQGWLARRFNVTRQTICEHIRKLRILGILDSRRRRRSAGHWQTNIYMLRGWIAWKLARSLATVRKIPDHVGKARHIASIRMQSLEKTAEKVARGDAASLILRLGLRAKALGRC